MTSASASRVTRSSRSLRLAVLLFAGCLAVVTVLRAQEPRPEKTTEATTSTEAEVARKTDVTAAANGEEAGPDDAPEPAADPTRKPGTVGPTPGRFEPTEKVRADFDVSFPVDI